MLKHLSCSSAYATETTSTPVAVAPILLPSSVEYDDEGSCIICYEDMDDHDSCRLSCGHRFHTDVRIHPLPPPPPPPHTHTHTHTDTYTHRHMSKHTAQYNYSTTKLISSSLVKQLFASTCCILVVILSGCKT